MFAYLENPRIRVNCNFTLELMRIQYSSYIVKTQKSKPFLYPAIIS